MNWRRGVALAAVFAVGAIGAESARAVVTIGPDPLPERVSVISTGGATVFTTASAPGVPLVAPQDGVVVRWRAQRGDGPGTLAADTITLRILRPAIGPSTSLRAISTSAAQPVLGDGGGGPEVYEFPTRQPVLAGDRLGLGTTTGTFPAFGGAGVSFLEHVGALGDGVTGTFEEGDFPRGVLINADIEPDVDADGFGDETQDLCPSDAATQGACPDVTAPETAITSKPEKRTKKRRARFSFSSSEAGSAFECKLDDAPFATCANPLATKVKRRKHAFEVRAVDAAGNVDATPARYSWRVKKKRR